MMLFSGQAIQLPINRGSDAIITDFAKVGLFRMQLGLTQELRNNVDAERLAIGYHRGAEKPVRWAGSPT